MTGTTTLTCTATRSFTGAAPGVAGTQTYTVRCQIDGTDHEWHQAKRNHDTRISDGDTDITLTATETIRWR